MKDYYLCYHAILTNTLAPQPHLLSLDALIVLPGVLQLLGLRKSGGDNTWLTLMVVFSITRTQALGWKPRSDPLVIPGNDDVLGSLPCCRHCSDMFGLVLQGENLDSGLCGWIRWWWRSSVATLLKALLLKNLVVLVVSWDGWCGYGHCCSMLIGDLIALEFFLLA